MEFKYNFFISYHYILKNGISGIGNIGIESDTEYPTIKDIRDFEKDMKERIDNCEDVVVINFARLADN
jgi:hypothetical protein